jgi:AraC family transcriptional regulator
VRPAEVEHANIYGPRGAECLIVGAHPDWVATDSLARDVFSTPRCAPAPAVLMVAGRIRREMRIGDRAAKLAVEGLTLEVIAAAARQLEDHRFGSAPVWLRAVRERLHDDFASDVRLYVLARNAGVHPVHLARAFRRCFGCSPGEYVRQRRIDRASNELADSNRSIGEIAMDAGFSSPSHFTTAFRRASGMTPREYRSAARSSRRVFRS